MHKTRDTDEVLREESLDGEGAQQLMAAFVGEITSLYPTWTPSAGPSADPEDFQPPAGTFVVIYVGGKPVACGGLKPIDADVAEIKRLYVRPDMRRRGLGRRLLDRLERDARAQGYTAVRLDTGAEQRQAVELFTAAGYRAIPDYNGNPFASYWFEKALR